MRCTLVTNRIILLLTAAASLTSCEKHRGLLSNDGSSQDMASRDASSQDISSQEVSSQDTSSGGSGDAGLGGASGGASGSGGSGPGVGGSGGSGGIQDAGRDAPPDAGPLCGNGNLDPGEGCDQGASNRANAYGKGLCTTQCQVAPYCGDGFINGPETCDSGGSGSTDLGSCNPECNGYYEKKIGKVTNNTYPTNMGGISGADAACQTEFGVGWKALIVGGTRRATVTPFVGDSQLDWVIHKYTHYYNLQNQLVWRTDDIPLLGIRGGARQNLYATFFTDSGNYPWAGWAADWTTLPDAGFVGTCGGWTASSGGSGSFVLSDLVTTASEPCGSSGLLLCVQQ